MMRRAAVIATACGALALPAAATAQSATQDGYAPVPGAPPAETPPTQPPVVTQAAPPPVQVTPAVVPTPPPPPPRTTQRVPANQETPTKPPASVGGPAQPTYTPVATPSASPSTGQLPYTGLDLGVLTAAGVVLLALGLVLRRVTTR